MVVDVVLVVLELMELLNWLVSKEEVSATVDRKSNALIPVARSPKSLYRPLLSSATLLPGTHLDPYPTSAVHLSI